MNYLDHIVPTREQAMECKYFCTITLPKSCYKKGPIKQYECMDRLYKMIASNYFELSYGCYEFTMKGNIHAHFLVKLREHVELHTNQASVKMMNAHLKRYSICDFQAIKDHDNVIKYIYKDKFETKSILVIKDPCRSCLPKPEEYKNPLSKRMEYSEGDKIYTKYLDEIYEQQEAPGCA